MVERTNQKGLGLTRLFSRSSIERPIEPVFSHAVTVAILVSQNNKTWAIYGVPNQSCGSWTLFLCKRFLLFQSICVDAGHVSAWKHSVEILKYIGAFLWDHPDQDQWSEITRISRSNEPMNPCPQWIHRLIWSTMIRVIWLDLIGSWNAPTNLYGFFNWAELFKAGLR